MYTALSRSGYVIVGGISVIVGAVAYGELRLLSRSVWPLFIMPTIGNAVMYTLLVNGFVEIPKKWQPIFNPSTESLMVIVLFAFHGFVLYRIRLKNHYSMRPYWTPGDRLPVVFQLLSSP
jgi:hypothetical protein